MAKDWIKKAVNPKHKGYCTPMTKSTCTPRRKAFAKTMKKHHGFHKMEDGGLIAYNPNLAANDVAFQNWYSKNTLEGQNNRPYNDKMDYDYYSFFRNNGTGSIENHFPDSYKRPSHKTFSNESIYSTPENPGGSWKGDTFIPPSKSTKMKKTYIPKAALGMQITQAGANAATAGARQAAAYVNPNTAGAGVGVGDIDYSGIFSMMAPFMQGNTDTRIQPGQQQVKEGASTGGLALGGAAKGAAMGSQFGPWGTAIGAVVGAGAGLLGASKERKRERKELNQIEAVNRDKYQNLDIDPNFDPYGEQSTFYMEDGGMVHNMGGPQEEQQQQPEQMKIVDIEKGELLVNPLTFDILREYTNPNKYSPHASNPQKEPIGNFTAISPGHMVIPKKLATKYKAGDTLSKKSIIMQIIKNQRNEPQEVIESPMGEVEEYGKGGVGCGGGSRMRDYAYGGYVEDAETIPVEVEGGEVYETPGGKVKKVKGPSHEKGGVAKVLPAGTKIYSDRLGIQSDTMADRKLKREQTINNVQSKLGKPVTDSMIAGLQTTLAKTTLEEEKDMREQEFLQYVLDRRKREGPNAGGTAPNAGSGGRGLAQIINAYGTGPRGLQIPGDDPWNTPGYNPEDVFANRTTNLVEDNALSPETYSQMNIAQKYGARPLPGGRINTGRVDPYAVSAGRDRTMMAPYNTTGFAKPDLGAMLRTNKLPYGVTSTAGGNNYMDDAPPPPGGNKFGVSGVDVSRALNFVPTAFGAGIAARYEPEIYDENTQLGRAKNLISEMETNPSIEASRNAIRSAGANRNKLLNNLNTPSTRAEAASTYGDVLNAEGELIQNATNTAMDARNKKRGALAEMEVKQGDARLNAREKLRVNMQMNRANSNKMIQSAFSELSQNYGAQVRDDAELNSINQILDYAKINKSGSLEDTKAFGAAVMDLMKSGKGVTVENLQDAYATSGLGYSKGRSNTKTATNRNVRAGIRSLLTPKKKG